MTDRLAPHRAAVDAEMIWALPGDDRTEALIAAGVPTGDLPALEGYCDSRAHEESGAADEPDIDIGEPDVDVNQPKPELLTEAELDDIARAPEAIVFLDGLEEGGGPEQYIYRSRYLARVVIDLGEKLREERSLRRALDARVERQERIILSRDSTRRVGSDA